MYISYTVINTLCISHFLAQYTGFNNLVYGLGRLYYSYLYASRRNTNEFKLFPKVTGNKKPDNPFQKFPAATHTPSIYEEY